MVTPSMIMPTSRSPPAEGGRGYNCPFVLMPCYERFGPSYISRGEGGGKRKCDQSVVVVSELCGL